MPSDRREGSSPSVPISISSIELKINYHSIIHRSSSLEEYAKEAHEKYPAEMQKLRDDLESGHFKSGRGSRKWILV